MSRSRPDHPSLESHHQADLYDIVHTLQHRLGSFDAAGFLLVRRSAGLPEVDISPGRDRRESDFHLFGAHGFAGVAPTCGRGLHDELYLARGLRSGRPILRRSAGYVVSLLLALSAKDIFQTLAVAKDPVDRRPRTAKEEASDVSKVAHRRHQGHEDSLRLPNRQKLTEVLGC